MNKFMGVLDNTLLPLSAKLSSNKILSAISKGLMGCMPVLIIGAIGSIFLNLPIDAYQAFTTEVGIHAILNNIVDLTTNLLALYAVFMITQLYVKNNGFNGVPAGIIALLAFLIVTPLGSIEIGGRPTVVLPWSWMGPKGLFTAMITAVLTGMIYSFFMKKKLVIKMPEGVPEFVSTSFAGIIPGAVIALVFGCIALIFTYTEYGTVHQLIYSLIQTPLHGLGTSLAAVVIIYILEGLCWFCGVHAIAVASVVMPIWMAADAENVAAIAAGLSANNIVTWSWVNSMASVGGAGGTLGLVIWMTFKSRSAKNKAMGKLALPASLFNINEPVVFGVPVVLNPILLIPFVFTPVISLIFGYYLTTGGVLPYPSGISAPAGTPLFISGFLVGGWKVAMWQFIMVFISMGIYFPFFKSMDKQSVIEEQAYSESLAKEHA